MQKAATTPLTNHKKNPRPRFNRNQQYSITALTDGGGTIVERFAYTAYGQVTILDTSLSQLATSAAGNRYTYTGREWDEALSLYHYRARMYGAVAGRFVSRDPIGYLGRSWGLFELVNSSPLNKLDPYGKEGLQVDLSPENAADVPYTFAPLPQRDGEIYLAGVTDKSFSVDCSCSTDANGCTLVTDCKITLKLFVRLDIDEITNSGDDWRQKLGHEQRHAHNAINKARSLARLLGEVMDYDDCCYSIKSDPGFADRLCSARAEFYKQKIEGLWRTFVTDEARHYGIPEAGRDYDPLGPIGRPAPGPPGWVE